jgi:hypothetical protein
MKCILSALLCFALILTTACTQNPEPPLIAVDNQTTSIDDEITTPTKKIIGSDMILGMSRRYFGTFEELVQEAMTVTNFWADPEKQEIKNIGKIIIGRVDSVLDIHTVCWSEHILDECPGRKFCPPVTYTDYNIIVDRVLFGEEVKSIPLSLEGRPDSHWGITKPEIGDNLLLFVQGNTWHGRYGYGVISFEEAMFRINDDGTMYSFSDQEITAQFDGKQLAVLESEISQVVREVIAARE